MQPNRLLDQSRTAVQQWAGFYQQSLGWTCTRLKPGSKEPFLPESTHVNCAPADFAPTENLGLVSVNGLVIADDDATERGLTLRGFFPRTPACMDDPRSLPVRRVFITRPT
jgi:hypothetical protein